MEKVNVIGRYHAVLRAWENGPILHEEYFDNAVCTLGKNAVWNAALAGSSYSVTGPFLGLISSVSFSAVSASDTMASHAGWTEADSTHAPAYTVAAATTRGTAVFGAASSGACAITALVFTFTGSGTVEGAFVAFGSGATNVWEATTGVLLSAGTFGSPQAVVNGNTLTVSYSISM